MEISSLSCSAVIEKLNKFGQVLTKKNLKNANILLGRNEVRDILLKVVSDKAVAYQFLLKEAKIFSKFMRNGKATITVQDNVHIFISNCPPDKLQMFLKGATVKLSGIKSFSSDKSRLYSFKPRAFDEISPLTQIDIQTYRNQQNCQGNTISGVNRSDITDKTPKRKRSELEGPRKRMNKGDLNPSVTEPEKEGGRSTTITCENFLNKSPLTVEQRQILESVKGGRSIFFTGSAGTGKSILLKRIIGLLPPESTVASASTGVAACQINGVTLHSFAGIGSGSADLERCIELAKRPQITQQWKKCQHLIIDEISMVDGEFFDKIEHVAQVIRRSSAPFGGIQLILCGDFLQLPPVSKGRERSKFCFQAQSWDSCVDEVFELTKIHRQKDIKFINILQYLRVGRCPDKVLERLKDTSDHQLNKDGIVATRLCTHRSHVAEINKYRMNELEGGKRVFTSYDDDPDYSKQMDNVLPVSAKLELKIGAQVMLTKNIDVQHGLVNGARGVVSSFTKDSSGFPVVTFRQGLKKIIKSEKFILKVSQTKFVTRHQVPLQLAWAMSIHKSQGLTLDCVEVSLSSVFEHGQAYVALSRATSLEGLRVLDIDQESIKAHPEVLKFYIKLRKQLRRESKMLENER